MFILFENYKAHCDNMLHPFGDYKKLLNLYLLKTLFIENVFYKNKCSSDTFWYNLSMQTQSLILHHNPSISSVN